MINQSSNQKAVSQRRVLSIQRTVVPAEYDSSTEGFNAWVLHVRSQVHAEFTPSKKMIAYLNLFKNVRRNETRA